MVGTCEPEDSCQPTNFWTVVTHESAINWVGNGPGRFLGFYVLDWVHTTWSVQPEWLSWAFATQEWVKERKVGNSPGQFPGSYVINQVLPARLIECLRCVFATQSSHDSKFQLVFPRQEGISISIRISWTWGAYQFQAVFPGPGHGGNIDFNQ